MPHNLIKRYNRIKATYIVAILFLLTTCICSVGWIQANLNMNLLVQKVVDHRSMQIKSLDQLSLIYAELDDNIKTILNHKASKTEYPHYLDSFVKASKEIENYMAALKRPIKAEDYLNFKILLQDEKKLIKQFDEMTSSVDLVNQIYQAIEIGNEFITAFHGLNQNNLSYRLELHSSNVNYYKFLRNSQQVIHNSEQRIKTFQQDVNIPINEIRQHVYWFIMLILTASILQWFAVMRPMFQSLRHEVDVILQSEKDMKEIAFTDPLTKICNRLSFHKYIDEAFSTLDRDLGPVSIILIDLDKFKPINDIYGHHAGDKVLIAVANRLKSTLRKGDVVARLGGDEFAVLIKGGRHDRFLGQFIKRLHNTICKPIRYKGKEIEVHCSIGAATAPNHSKSAKDLLICADKAMYFAKTSKTVQTSVYQDAHYCGNKAQEFHATDLIKAIEQKEFFMQYQPKVELKSGKVVGFESLIRWKHPQLGMIPPKEFLIDLETNGLLPKLTNFVTEEVYRAHGKWQEMGLEVWPTSINLPDSVLQKGFDPLFWADEKLKTDNNLNWLAMEVSEIIFQHRSKEELTNRLNKLRDNGATIILDDFGLGEGSMVHLKSLNVDILKINRLFTDEILTNNRSAAIVTSLITLADMLDIKALVEGVETQEQVDWLIKTGVKYAQGFYFARPMSFQEATLLLTEEKCLGQINIAKSLYSKNKIQIDDGQKRSA